jgi:hypothetical protein
LNFESKKFDVRALDFLSTLCARYRVHFVPGKEKLSKFAPSLGSGKKLSFFDLGAW